MTPEHYAQLSEAVLALDTPERRERYRNGDFPRSNIVNDLHKRYRWDLWFDATEDVELRNMLNEYHTQHLDTALRRIVPEF